MIGINPSIFTTFTGVQKKQSDNKPALKKLRQDATSFKSTVPAPTLTELLGRLMTKTGLKQVEQELLTNLKRLQNHPNNLRVQADTLDTARRAGVDPSRLGLWIDIS